MHCDATLNFGALGDWPCWLMPETCPETSMTEFQCVPLPYTLKTQRLALAISQS